MDDIEELRRREEALTRINAALDDEMGDLDGDVEAMLERQRHEELELASRGAFSAPAVPALAPAPAPRSASREASSSARRDDDASAPAPGRTRWRSARPEGEATPPRSSPAPASGGDAAYAWLGGASAPAKTPRARTPEGRLAAQAERRLGKAQADVLREDLDREKQKSAALERTVGDLEAKLSVLEKDRKMQKRDLDKLKALVEKDAKARKDAEDAAAAAKRDLAAAERALREVKRDNAHKGKDQHTKDVRLTRALEDVEKLKKGALVERQNARDAADEFRAEREGFEVRIKKLEKQKAELLGAFRKQTKLIDILKKQKTHLEAARLLAFTEDEFMKVVNWEGDLPANIKDGVAPPAPPDLQKEEKRQKEINRTAAPPRARAKPAAAKPAKPAAKTAEQGRTKTLILE